MKDGEVVFSPVDILVLSAKRKVRLGKTRSKRECLSLQQGGSRAVPWNIAKTFSPSGMSADLLEMTRWHYMGMP